MRLALAASSVILLIAALISMVLVVTDTLPLRWHKRTALACFVCFLLALAFRGLSS